LENTGLAVQKGAQTLDISAAVHYNGVAGYINAFNLDLLK
jgi:hypothetical protein